MSTNGLGIRRRILRATKGAIGKDGKTTLLAGGTDRVRDALRWDMNTLSPEDISGAFIRIGQVYSGTATGSGATSLTDSTAAFGTLCAGSLGPVVVAFTAAGATTAMAVTSNTGTALTGAAWTNGTPSSTSLYYVTYCHVAKVTRMDPLNGDIYFDPAVPAAVLAGALYELWYFGIRPDDVDIARDDAFELRDSMWRMKPLSVVKEVADWRTGVLNYDTLLGGASLSTAVAGALSFPVELFGKSVVVTNSSADGGIFSESFYVQPTQTLRVFGWASVRAREAFVRFFDVTNGRDVELDTQVRLTLRGWQWFNEVFTVPAGCEELQLELGGASASCISEWAGVGVMPMHERIYSHESRVLSRHDLGTYYAYDLPSNQSHTSSPSREPIAGVRREPAGDGVVAIFDEPPLMPVYYQERHRYSALQSDYLALTDRATGDYTATDCNVDYAAWTTLVELLEPRKRVEELDRLYKTAEKNVRALDRRVGADPVRVAESRTQGGIPVYSL